MKDNMSKKIIESLKVDKTFRALTCKIQFLTFLSTLSNLGIETIKQSANFTHDGRSTLSWLTNYSAESIEIGKIYRRQKRR